MTLFDGLWDKFIFILRSPFMSVYYFSELNEKSLTLAESILQNQKGVLIAFCNVGNTNVRLIGEARIAGCALLSENEVSQRLSGRKKRFYFEIAEDMDANLNGVKKLLQVYENKSVDCNRLKIFLFTTQPEAEIVLNATDKHGIEVNIVNINILTAYKLIYEKPLYEGEKNNSISVLIIGTTHLATEILRAVLWCGQLGEERSLQITVIDKEAMRCKAILKRNYPELIDGDYTLNFIDVDTETENFKRVLDESCQDTTYVITALDSDKKNIETALYLRAYYLRGSLEFENEPTICAYIQNDTKASVTAEFAAVDRDRIQKKGWDFSTKAAQYYKIYPFGSSRSIYSYEAIMDSEIEKLALNCSAVYELAFSSGAATSEQILASYNADETNKRSNRAAAIHIKYKLHALGFQMTDASRPSEPLKELEDKNTLEALSRLEHSRWMAFQRSEGYCGATIEETQKYIEQTKSHKYVRAKLHVCICDWDKLDEAAALFDPDFKKYDENLIKSIPDVLGITDNSKINLSGIKYNVERLDENAGCTSSRLLS
ncbi:MAG: hypothetical protein Q4C12_08335 [Clostridia bacterium]|nr:hypothetical protein [Clostridia bacterium]